ncbi:MAG: hypothetical protein IJZ88_02915 [Clostridia bacterium]|nr:hypothetical protein [Clostridia bacterium]
MKKIISLVLSLVLVFSCVTVAFAQEDDYVPTIHITGMANTSLVMDLGLETEKQVFGAEEEDMNAMIENLIPPVLFFLLGGSEKRFAKSLVEAVNPVFEYIKYDVNGESAYNVTIERQPRVSYGYSSFIYDWRADPMLVADELRAFVEEVKAFYGSEKVNLIAESMGGVIASAYIYKYGYSDLNAVIYRSTAMYGLTLIGELYTGNFDFKAKDIAQYVNNFMLGESSQQVVIRSLIKNVAPLIVNPLVNKIDRFFEHESEYIYDEFLIDIFGYLPGLWSFVPDEYYEDAKEFMLDETVNAKLIEKIDVYQYQVRPSINSTIKAMEASGVTVAFVSHYGFSAIPATQNKSYMADALIDTKYTSGGATCSNYGEILGEDYVQAVDDGHNHISPDNMIDASTCLLPEKTWFVKGMLHTWYSDDYRDLYAYILEQKGAATVHSNPKFPQFLMNNEDDGTTLPMTEENMYFNNDEVTIEIAFDFIKGLFA